MKILSLILALVSSFGALQAADAPATTYPLQTCVVSGEKLGEMGKPYVFTVDGTEVQLCCAGCKKRFEKDPEKFLSKVKEAAQPAKP